MELLVASAVLGLLKGVLVPSSAGEPTGFSFEHDVWAPTREELLYRAAPLWAFPRLPYGSTAVVFAADHVLDDLKETPPPTAGQAAARFGDVFLGGLLYETAFRRQGVVAAIAAHMLHNAAVALGARVRR